MDNTSTFNKIKILSYLSCLLFVLLFNTQVLATEKAQDKKHHIGAFLGVLDNAETESVIGIEYEFKFDQNWGAGITYEDANNAHHGAGASSTIGSVYYHHPAGWRFGVGAGSEKIGGEHSSSETLYRVGVAYEFHVGGVGIAPSFSVDKVDGETANVYGVAVIYSF